MCVDQLQRTERKQEAQLYTSTENEDTNLITELQQQNAKWLFLSLAETLTLVLCLHLTEVSFLVCSPQNTSGNQTLPDTSPSKLRQSGLVWHQNTPNF